MLSFVELVPYIKQQAVWSRYSIDCKTSASNMLCRVALPAWRTAPRDRFVWTAKV